METDKSTNTGCLKKTCFSAKNDPGPPNQLKSATNGLNFAFWGAFDIP